MKCRYCQGDKFRKYKDKRICVKCKAYLKQADGFNLWTKQLSIFLLTFLILSMGIVLADVIINDFNSASVVTSSPSYILSYNISTDYMQNITFHWDGTAYSIYDPSLVLFMNFDNRSELSENETYVNDLSQYSNNGTVVGGSNITHTPNGKYGGAFNFSGGVNRINYNTISLNNFTYSFWINTATIVGTDKNIISNTDAYSRIARSNALLFIESDTNGVNIITSAVTLSANTWIHVVFVKDGNYSYAYTNGVLSDSEIINADLNLTTSHIGGDSERYFNGSIDDVIIFNKSLSVSEINELYGISYTKYDSQNHTIIINQSLNTVLNSLVTSYNFPYYICTSNSTGSENCSSQKVITQTIPNKNIVINFTNSIGIIRSDFYGINRGLFISNLSKIAPNGDNVFVFNSDADFYKNALENMKIVTIRNDMGLELESYDSNLNKPIFNYSGNSFYDVNITGKKEMVAYAKANNIKILWVASYMPNWLANKTSGWCNITSGINTSCPPSNYSLWGDVVYEFLDTVGCDANTCEVEVWNEPNEKWTWLSNLSTSNIIRSIELNKLINATYQAVQRFNNSMQVFAPATHIYGTENTILWQNFMGNFSNSILYPNLHLCFHYISTDYTAQQVLDTIFGNCSSYGFDCSRIYSSEWKHKNATEQNTTNLQYKWNENIAEQYITYLKYPQNISSSYFKLEGGEKYNINQSEYPLVAKMMSGPSLDITYYPPYNVTKSFATLCPAGGTVYSSSSDDSDIKTVSCKDGNKYNIIVINTGTTSKNVSIDVHGLNIPSLNDMFASYNYSLPLGIMDSYEIRYESYEDISELSRGCSSLTNDFTGFIPWIGIILLVLAAGVVITLFVTGNMEGDIMAWILGLFLVGILLIITLMVILTILGTGGTC